MDGNEELGAAIIGGLDNLLQICLIAGGFVHCGVMDGVSELLQFGDQGFDYGAVDLTLTEAFIFGSVSCACCRVPGVDTNLNGSHLLSCLFSN